MKILSIGKKMQDNRFNIANVSYNELANIQTLDSYSYILISGGDGAIRRVVKTLHNHFQDMPPFILNPVGSFNVVAKLHRVPNYTAILDNLHNEANVSLKTQIYYSLNKEIFLFSAGNMGDLQHIFLSETLRFGILKNGMAKYVLAGLFLLPLHLIITPFMLLSPRRFFVFTPANFIKKFGSFYGSFENIKIDLDNNHNHIELDGDIVTIEEQILHIEKAGEIKIVS